MANIGEQLLQPESGWQRIDDSNVNISYNGTWYTSSPNSSSGGDFKYTQINGGYLEFYVYTSKIRFINFLQSICAKNSVLNIDGEAYSYSSYISGGMQYQILAFEKLDMSKSIHKIKLTNIENAQMNLDAIDIDEDGRMCTQEEYELQEAKKKLFPVRVADDTVTTEENVANYTATLTNGERQLLLLNNGEMYLSDGNGSHIKMGSGNNCFIKASYFGDPTV